MKIHKYENNILESKVIEYFDKISMIASNSNYTLGKSDKPIDTTKKIGRYGFNFTDIYNIDISISLNFLIYTQEGHIKQDELILTHFEKFLFPKYKDFLIKYENNTVTLNNITYTLEIANMLAAIHLVGYYELKKFIENKESNNEIEKILKDFLNYDISSLIKYKSKKESIVVNEKVLKKDGKNNFLSFLEDLLKKAPSLIEKAIFKKNPEIEKLEEKIQKTKDTKELSKLISKKNELEVKDKKLESLMKNLPSSKNFDNKNSSIVMKPNKDIIDKLEYKDNSYVENTTNKKIKDNPNHIDSMLSEYNKETKGNVKKQKGFSSFRKKKSNNIDILDILIYLIDHPSVNKTPLETIERSLLGLRLKNVKKNFIAEVSKNATYTLIEKGFSYVDEKIKEYTTGKNKEFKTPVIEGYDYIEDITFDIEDITKDNFRISRPYYILSKISVEHEKSYKPKFIKSRTLLDMILIAFIQKITKVQDRFDGVKEFNALDDVFIRINKEKEITYDQYIELFNHNNLNITKWIVYQIFEKGKFNNKLYDINRFLSEHKIYDYYEYVINKDSNDKSLIKDKFKNHETFKNYCFMNKFQSIYLFYLNFFLKDDNKTQYKDSFVVEGAKLICTLGIGESRLIVENSKEYINGKKKASIYDTKITPFSGCKVCKVCAPKIVAPFVSTSNNIIDNKEALTKSATAICSFGGVISIIDANQSKQDHAIIETKNLNKYSIDTKNKDIEESKIRNKWMDCALKEYKDYYMQKENSELPSLSGNICLKDRINMYHKEAGSGIKNGPWCMAFVNFIMKQAINSNIKTSSTDQFSKIAKNEYKTTKKPYYGSIVYFKKYNKKGEYTGHGHIGFVIGINENKDAIYCLGGNQSNQIKISKYRIPKNNYANGSMDLKCYFWPKDEEITKEVYLTKKDEMKGLFDDESD